MPYLTHILFVVGLIFIALEVTVLGFSSLILFFVGLAFIATSLLFWTGIFAPSLVVALSLSIAFTLFFAAALWRPFKRMQNKTDTKPLEHDFTQHEFVLTRDVDANTTNALHQYSGVQWQVKSQTPLQQGQKVKVVRCEVGILWVEAVEN